MYLQVPNANFLLGWEHKLRFGWFAIALLADLVVPFRERMLALSLVSSRIFVLSVLIVPSENSSLECLFV